MSVNDITEGIINIGRYCKEHYVNEYKNAFNNNINIGRYCKDNYVNNISYLH